MSFIKKFFTKTSALLLCATLLFNSVPAFAAEAKADTSIFASNINGLYVQTAGGGFPSVPELSGGEMKKELDTIVDFAALYGFNNIFFEAVSEGGAFYRSSSYSQSESISAKNSFFLFDFFRFDPLKYLVKQAEKKNISVTAVVDPFLVYNSDAAPKNKKHIANKKSEHVVTAGSKLYLNPSKEAVQKLVAKTTTELARKYDLGSIMLKNFSYPSQGFELSTTNEEKSQILTTLLTDISSAAKKANPQIAIGFETGFSFEATQNSNFTGEPNLFSAHGVLDYVVPVITETLHEEAYENELLQWQQGEVRILSANSAVPAAADKTDEETTLTSASALTPLYLQLYQNGISGANGCVIKNYNDIKSSELNVALGLSASFKENQMPADTERLNIDLTIPQVLNITRPAEALRTSYSSYYITGTSNPALPLTFDGEAIAQAPKGAFGVCVELAMGKNTFIAQQGDIKKTIEITRYDSNLLSASTTTKMQQSSIFPKWEEAVREGGNITLSCVAPSGATVTALVSGQKVELKQIAAASDGVPARFTGKATAQGGKSDETVRLGKIEYTMSYNGESSSYTSNGELSIIGKNANYAVEVTDMRGDTSSVDAVSDFRDNMITSVEKGAQSYVSGQSANYLSLSFGGYIHKEDVRVLEGKADIDNAWSIGEITYENDSKGLNIKIPSKNRPYYVSEYKENTVIITFYNTALDIDKSSDFTDENGLNVLWESENNTTTLTLQTSGKRFWGYNVEFAEGVVIVRTKSTPKLSDNPAQPLKGVDIILDAGHGGNDPGALGIAGLTGPTEKELNYMNAYATYKHLTAMGASVHMTQTKDERLSYEQRMDVARDTRADFYISFHHNSTAETSDSTNAKGIEVYYNEELSIPFGEAMLEELGNTTGRKKRGVLPATFRVTQMTHTPSLLCELGYVVSPEEYEQLCNPLYIYKAALGTGNAIIKLIQEANA